MRPGFAGDWMPERTVRMALLARLTNAFTGRGKLSLQTVDAICELLNGDAPPVPLQGQAGAGEVMPLGWLLAPLAALPLRQGEAMALVNGSPFASAVVADVAPTSRKQLQLAISIFALSAEAARIPVSHFEPRLAEAWPDPYYAEALERLSALLVGARDPRLPHQAPVAWRITPNTLAGALRASNAAATVAELALRSLKDNPTFLLGETEAEDLVISGGGYQDYLAGRAIDTVNAAWSDLAFLAYRQVAKLSGGVDLGLPHLLSRGNADGVGLEYIVWTLTSSLAEARQAAVPAGLDLSLEDPGGNQSDVVEPAIVAYARHLKSAKALNECLAALYATARAALEIRQGHLPEPLGRFCADVPWTRGPEEPNAGIVGRILKELSVLFQERTTQPTFWA